MKVKTALGKTIDMGALIAKNDKTRAVGNMKVNARGDTIDGTGKVIKSVNEKVATNYSRTVGNKSANVVERRPTKQAKPANITVSKEETELLQDPGAGIWINDFVLATLKITIGEAREKYSTIAGPSGGTALNGAAMKSEGKAQQEQLIDELKRYVDYSQPLTWIQG